MALLVSQILLLSANRRQIPTSSTRSVFQGSVSIANKAFLFEYQHPLHQVRLVWPLNRLEFDGRRPNTINATVNNVERILPEVFSAMCAPRIY
jgi:hypothetical protein